MMESNIIIVGGGLTGLTMAVSLSVHNIPVTIIAPDLAVAKKDDKRSTAIMMDGVDFLKKIDVWQNCEKYTAPLEVMRIISRSQTIDFDACEMGKQAFAINVPNQVLLKSLIKKIKSSKNITCINDRLKSVQTDNDHVTIHTEKNKIIKGEFLIAADGRQSIIRAQQNIPDQRHDFKQKALVCALSHTKSHHNISTEIHRAGGPFTLVPLPNNESALVWCDRPDIIDNIISQPKHAQEDMIAKVIPDDFLGDIKMISAPQSWPIHALKSAQVTLKRTAFIGESAHALAPIAAQGFNLSLRDIVDLTDMVIEGQRLGLDIGSATLLKSYAQKRKTDITLRYHSVGILNTLISDTSLPASVLKKIGLSTMEWVSPLRQMAMRFGMRA